MSSSTQRYPLSTPEGSAIPLDIMKPHSFIRKAFTANVVSSAIVVPADVEILSLTANADCIICFGGTAVAPVDGISYSKTLYLDKCTRIIVAPNADTFTVLGLGVAGILNIQMVEKWAGLALSKQLSGR